MNNNDLAAGLNKKFNSLDFEIKNETSEITVFTKIDNKAWFIFNFSTLEVKYLCESDYYEDVILIHKVCDFVFNYLEDNRYERKELD